MRVRSACGSSLHEQIKQRHTWTRSGSRVFRDQQPLPGLCQQRQRLPSPCEVHARTHPPPCTRRQLQQVAHMNTRSVCLTRSHHSLFLLFICPNVWLAAARRHAKRRSLFPACDFSRHCENLHAKANPPSRLPLFVELSLSVIFRAAVGWGGWGGGWFAGICECVCV